MGKKDPRIDAYIAKSAPFARPILQHLRKVVHSGCPGVEETLKWSMPAFMYKGPLVGIAAFKQHCTLGFWKHSLLDAQGLSKSDEKAMGQFGRITSMDDLPSEKALCRLVERAASLNDQGIKVARVKKAPKKLEAPAYFMTALRGNKKALATFQDSSPSFRNEYVEWVTEAKTEPTRKKRLETAVEWIAEGKGRNWKYERK
jgi:uncharacterized protein YdeI (YjbR/CyaY-like superfamily)